MINSNSSAQASDQSSLPNHAPRKKSISAAAIADKLYLAILEHRIPPGTKLAEERLAAIFSVNRARVREALARLGHDRVVDIIPHQGAHVAKPTADDARDVFEARRLIEPFIVRKLSEGLTQEKTGRLRRHLDAEKAAREQEDKPKIIRLSGEFHILLAELADNAALLRTTRELAIQTCLTISLYSASTVLSCRADEHEDIANCIIGGDAEKAVSHILEHFDHIESSLALNDASLDVDLESLFADA